MVFAFFLASRNKLILSFQFNFTWMAANVRTEVSRCITKSIRKCKKSRAQDSVPLCCAPRRSRCAALWQALKSLESVTFECTRCASRALGVHDCKLRETLESIRGCRMPQRVPPFFLPRCRATDAETAVLLNRQLNWCNFEVFAVLGSIRVIWSFANSIKRN